jgi:hypothetical protein
MNHASQVVIFQDYHSTNRRIAGLTDDLKRKIEENEFKVKAFEGSA